VNPPSFHCRKSWMQIYLWIVDHCTMNYSCFHDTIKIYQSLYLRILWSHVYILFIELLWRLYCHPSLTFIVVNNNLQNLLSSLASSFSTWSYTQLINVWRFACSVDVCSNYFNGKYIPSIIMTWEWFINFHTCGDCFVCIDRVAQYHAHSLLHCFHAKHSLKGLLFYSLIAPCVKLKIFHIDIRNSYWLFFERSMHYCIGVQTI